MKKKWIIGAVIIGGLYVVGSLNPSDVPNETTQVEQQKTTPTQDLYNEKLEYFKLHTSNRMNNITSNDLSIINQEIKICNTITKELLVFLDDNNLTQSQVEELNQIVNKLNDINVSYNTNKVKIEKK